MTILAYYLKHLSIYLNVNRPKKLYRHIDHKKHLLFAWTAVIILRYMKNPFLNFLTSRFQFWSEMARTIERPESEPEEACHEANAWDTVFTK